MASVIRVKRRRNDVPAEALLLSQKRSRLDSSAANGVEIDSVLEFAGTLPSKTEPVASRIKEAIKKRKLHKQLHPHYVEPKPTSDRIKKARAQNTETSQRNRYHIICSRRAIDIDSLDTQNPAEDSLKKSLSCDADVDKDDVDTKECFDSATVACSSASEAKTCLKRQRVPTDQSEDSKNPTSDKTSTADNETNSQDKSDEPSDKVVCLLDVEHHGEQGAQASKSGITVNNVPMISKKSIEEESDDYVYDLYYTHTQLSEQHLEDFLAVEAMCNELIHPDLLLSDDDEVDDLDEDSNDESNWRNDYPEEDPGFFENEGLDYDYEDDMVQRNYGDDEGDALAYWMDTRCRIEVDCSDFTNDDDKERSDDESSNDEYDEDGNY